MAHPTFLHHPLDEDTAGSAPRVQDDLIDADMYDSDTCGTRTTAYACALALLRFHLRLHEPFHFKDRTSHSVPIQQKGTAWADALRKHANGACGHYYGHVAFAHLEELINEHGNLQPVNDEVLEKGNRDMKRFRDLTYWGGDSSKAAQETTVMQKRYRLIREASEGEEAVYEQFTVPVQRHHASWIECMKMQVAADLLASRRPHEADQAIKKAKRAAAKRARDSERDDVKGEVEAVMVKCNADCKA